jgi:hypothetical protein
MLVERRVDIDRSTLKQRGKGCACAGPAAGRALSHFQQCTCACHQSRRSRHPWLEG